LIQFENVGFRYGRGSDVLQGLNFEVPDGAFTFVTGASGAGKSSLLRLLYLDDLPTAGKISLFGRDVASLTRDEIAWFRRRIGVVFIVNRFSFLVLPRSLLYFLQILLYS